MDQHLNDNFVSTIQIDLHKPKRILHFSDGVLEEFSDEDEEIKDDKINNQIKSEIVESELPWGPWILHKSWKAGSSALAGCDYVGAALSSFLGITTPKYAFEFEEFKRRQKEEEFLENEKKEAASWQEAKQLNPNFVITTDMSKMTGRF